MRIKDISKENRPRERFKKNGAYSLSDAELLAIILEKGTRYENVIDMSNRLITTYGLSNLSTLSFPELQKIKGIGPVKAMQVKALFEFNKRYNISKQDKNVSIKSAKDVFNYAHERLKDLDREHFVILHLDTKNKITKDETISIGILNASLIHPREVFKSAIKESANSIILVHNHPSGDCAPSDEDLSITKKLIKAGELLNIKVLDHVIIGDNSYWSYIEK
ncbi:MAG: DNA repair protein RadC [Nanohaloarchaea archaeon]|nr:DNA repair protein RadC [Candidatus Nanohaloarchaea archaeon]